jgi:hypothetical protein
MEITFIDFNPNTPIKNKYDYITDYISHDFDLEFEDAFFLIKQLKQNRSSIVVYGKAITEFHIYDNLLHVQIEGSGFWFAENIDLKTARIILKLTFEGCDYFGQYLPHTNKEWEAYTP